MLKKYLLGAAFSIVCLSGFAQQDTTRERRATIDSIHVVVDYRPILADAVKIRRNPDMTNKREYQPKLAYHILDKKLDINTGTKALTIQEMSFVDPTERRDNYVKLGAGNYGTFLGEAYLSADIFEDGRIGAYAKHLNQMGTLEKQSFSQQQVGIFGRQILESVTLDGELGYKRYGTNFYGYIPDSDGFNLNTNIAKQAFNDVFVSGEMTSKYAEGTQDDLSFSLKGDGYLYSNAYEAKENSIAISGYLNKRINVFNIGANVSADFTNVSDVDYKLGNHIARINPYIRFQGINYHVTLGVNFVSEFGDSSRTNIFPTAAVDFPLVPEYAHLFGGITGDVNKTSLRELTRENPWMGDNLSIRNSLERMHIYGGIKGNASATFGYKVQAFFKSIESMPFYANRLGALQQFDVIYESADENSTVVGLEAEVNLRLSEMVILGGKVNFNEYNLKTQEEAWFMPKMKLSANTRINISDKLYVNGELMFQGITYARLLEPDFDGAGVPPASTPWRTVSVSMPSFVDLSAGAEYRVTPHIGVYLRANNLLNTNYERYMYYPRLGFNVMGGVNFSF